MRGFKKPSRLAQKEGVYESSTIETKYKNLKKKSPMKDSFYLRGIHLAICHLC